MFNHKKKYQNIFWFLVDGLRPDFLNLDGKNRIDKNFLEIFLSDASVFNNVITTAAGTHTSMHSIFTSLLPSFNGATGWVKQALRTFDQDIFTIADYFLLSGYKTFRYCDADGERTVPMSGFQIWESSGYRIGDILHNTDLTKCDRRDCFIKEVNMCKMNKFVYHHIELLHDLNGSMGTFWTSEKYAENIKITAKELEKLFYEYVIGEDDLVIISSDHGVILDRDFLQDGVENGERHYEESVRTFFALKGKSITSQILSNMISSLDIAPTLLHAALDITMETKQGEDRYDYLKKGIYKQGIYYREKGSYNVSSEKSNSLTSDVFYVRDEKWKYVFGENDPRCEWLINLEENEDYQVNLKDMYPKLVKKYHDMINRIYKGKKEFRVSYQITKKDVPVMFSIVFQTGKIAKETIESFIDMAGPYYEILVADCCEIKSEYRKNYKIRIVDVTKIKDIEKSCKGEWIVYIKRNGGWSEYFLSDLYRYILSSGRQVDKIIGKNYSVICKKENRIFNKKTYASKKIRALTYPSREYVEKKYILFGCGKIGKRALDYCGRENVFCFVDNDNTIIGKEKFGKKVISFEKLKEIHNNYEIVISSGGVYEQEICQQLEDHNIHDYLFLDYGLLP